MLKVSANHSEGQWESFSVTQPIAKIVVEDDAVLHEEEGLENEWTVMQGRVQGLEKMMVQLENETAQLQLMAKTDACELENLKKDYQNFKTRPAIKVEDPSSKIEELKQWVIGLDKQRTALIKEKLAQWETAMTQAHNEKIQKLEAKIAAQEEKIQAQLQQQEVQWKEQQVKNQNLEQRCKRITTLTNPSLDLKKLEAKLMTQLQQAQPSVELKKLEERLKAQLLQQAQPSVELKKLEERLKAQLVQPDTSLEVRLMKKLEELKIQHDGTKTIFSLFKKAQLSFNDKLQASITQQREDLLQIQKSEFDKIEAFIMQQTSEE